MLYSRDPDVPGAIAEVNRLRKIIDARLGTTDTAEVNRLRKITVTDARPPAAKEPNTEGFNTEGLDFSDDDEGGYKYNGLFDMAMSG